MKSKVNREKRKKNKHKNCSQNKKKKKRERERKKDIKREMMCVYIAGFFYHKVAFDA